VEQIAAKVGKTPVYIATRLKLTDLSDVLIYRVTTLLASFASLQRSRIAVASIQTWLFHGYSPDASANSIPVN
jgi:hypothetical protein